MDDTQNTFDPIRLFVQHPEFICEAISLYYPLPIEWMRQYGDILRWGGMVNADISEHSSRYFYEPGIALNNSINWNGETRALTLAHLATKGRDRAIKDDTLWNKRNSSESPDSVEDELSRRVESLVAFVRNCPMRIEDVITSYAEARHEHYRSEFIAMFDEDPDNESFALAYPQYWVARNMAACMKQVLSECAPTITEKLSIGALAALLEGGQMPSLMWNKNLWTLTLSQILTPEITKEVLSAICESWIGSEGELSQGRGRTGGTLG